MVGGSSEITNEKGDKLRGTFEEGKLQGQGMVTYKNGDTFHGEFEDGLRHGPG